MINEKEKQQLMECPNCGFEVMQKFRSIFKIDKVIIENFKGKGDITTPIHYIVTQCKKCNEVALFSRDEGLIDTYDLENNCSLLYPYAKKVLDGVPEIIRKSYFEAKKIQSQSSAGSAVLLRRALEYVCQEQKSPGRNLNDKLKHLSDKGIIPTHLYSMANTLRFLGNVGAHPSDFEISHSEIDAINDFFIAICEYVYIAPSKIKKLEKKLGKFRPITT